MASHFTSKYVRTGLFVSRAVNIQIAQQNIHKYVALCAVNNSIFQMLAFGQ